MTPNNASRASRVSVATTAHSRAEAVTREILIVLLGALTLTLVGQIAVPLPFTPVPVTLGTLAALGVGAMAGTRRGVASVAVYGTAAAVGAPVLAGWSSGVGVTFGYVLGYALTAAIAGRATLRRPDGSAQPLWVRLGLMVLASAAVYVPGLVWLKVAAGISWGHAVTLGLLPFIIGDLLKSVLAALPPQRLFR